ncbi:T6SS phospholipase effector Tle1-like catalytic domain-containing protein [Pedobacter sp. NJ-S-72]
MSKGNIIKISNGHMNEIAKLEHTSSAKTINSNAAGTINEKGAEGVKFGEPKEMKFTTVDGVDILAGMFFDGTLNNMYNTKSKAGEGSYQNDYSNVARLFMVCKEVGASIIKIYVEGMGSKQKEKDDDDGSGFGANATGIPARVMEGCVSLADQISSKVPGKNVKTLTIDVFFFSRGAAAARNFIFEVGRLPYKANVSSGFFKNKFDVHGQRTTLENLPKGGELGRRLLENKIKVKEIKIRFVGLFDTVSSYNNGFSLMPDFTNDVKELHLNSLGSTERVIHLTASDEHRKYFALTRIQSAGTRGIEKDMPGVHSDIGGSYPSGEEIVPSILKGTNAELQKEKQRLINESWYLDRQLVINKGKLIGTRDFINHYSFIPLHFMCEFSLKFSKPLTIDEIALKKKYPISDNPQHLLCFIKTRLHDYVFGNAEPLKFKYFKELDEELKMGKLTKAAYNKEIVEQKNLRLLRNGYLHWSSNFEGIAKAFQPNIEGGQLKRHNYEG